ncbi:MAG: L-alanine exporter AlaE [Nitrospinae bacterium]|nr:L-alanine exporter AlaE [Nitrospinota bacterium]MBI3813041.1 L-alanine exporter AlaE [Nitrospinota bacterium]
MVFFADTFAMITFSTVVGMVIEILVSGMTLGQSAQARLTAIPANLLTARLYGIFRDWVFQLMRALKGGQVKEGIADIMAFILFQVPLYATILAISGANVHQIATACGAVTILSVFMGRPYGIFLDFSRWLFRIKRQSN